jgi:NhaA family Na+:H+ antiporter
VIALFYTAQISWAAIGSTVFCVSVLVLANRMGVRHPLPYALLGVLLWVAVLQSGVHATIAGVLLAMTIPSRTELDAPHFLLHSRAVLDHVEQSTQAKASDPGQDDLYAAIEALEDSCEKAQAPLQRLEHALHPWVTFLIMPVFALANAGVAFKGTLAANLSHPVMLGIVLGLVLGKPAGIVFASWVAVRFRLASLPSGVSWSHIHGAGWLGGIGFTMSLFVAGLAFTDEALLTVAKLSILAASAVAALVGSALLLSRRAN